MMSDKENLTVLRLRRLDRNKMEKTINRKKPKKRQNLGAFKLPQWKQKKVIQLKVEIFQERPESQCQSSLQCHLQVEY